MSIIRWLHISDLHFNSKNAITNELRDMLPKFLSKKNFQCDYVFCTGDLRTANATPNDFTDEMATFLKEVCASVGTTVDKLFIVPGNHDVDRNWPGRDKAVRHVCFHRSGSYDPEYGEIDKVDLETIHDGQTQFRSFLTKLYPEDRLTYYNDPLEPHFNIETPDFNVLHLDSTLTYTQDQEAMDLVVGTLCLQNALQKLNPKKPTILLTHYPITSLLQDERKQISEMLYRRGVRLWLAGHEHDHMIQPIKYIDSVQAGELRKEKGANATILIGEYDEEFFCGRIKAYSWFTEGWAPYPIIWHGGKKEDEFPFALRLPEDNGLSREAVKAKSANKEYLDRMPESINKELLPEMQIGRNSISCSLGNYLAQIWNTDTPHLIINADGGMGKTTMLLNECQGKEKVVLYIPVEKLVAMQIGVREYITRVLFIGNNDYFAEFAGIKYRQPSLTLMVDGLNEVDGMAERRIINEIEGINLFQGIQTVITSRSDFTSRHLMSGYRNARLIPLNEDQIKSVFSKDELDVIKTTTTLYKLLTNPMMITMYKQVSPIIQKYRTNECFDWIVPMKNASDLLHNYYVAQIAIMFDRFGTSGEHIMQAQQIVFGVLPALGYAYETGHRINMRREEFRALLQKVVCDFVVNKKKLLPIQEHFRHYSTPELNFGIAIDILIHEMCLIYSDDSFVSFPHQINRDYLSANWIVQVTERDDGKEQIDAIWNERSLPYPVMEHIRSISGRYWNGIAEKVHGEGKGRTDAAKLVGNLLDCFVYTEDSGCPDYSNLDLRGVQLPDVAYPPQRIPLTGAMIDNVSLGKIINPLRVYSFLRFSRNNDFLAAFADGSLYIFPLQSDKQPFVHVLGCNVRNLLFSGEYLFVATNEAYPTIAVYFYDGAWTYRGRICIEGTYNFSVLNKRLHSIILSGDVMHFYYNNREVCYSISDCTQISNVKRQRAWQTAVDGTDLTGLKTREKNLANRDMGVAWTAENNGLKATAYVDGQLDVTNGSEIQEILARGITLLKDGSISGNGIGAVTLSYALFGMMRKVQMWDLNAQKKIRDIYCPGEINRIFLSENGIWIFGETDKKTWVYNSITNEEKWFCEHFISNQRGKVSTFEDKVLRKDKENRLYLYDLTTGEASDVETPCKNVCLACFLPNNSVAAVGNNIKKVRFKGIRNNSILEIKSNNKPIIGLQSIPGKPFIAVATQDNVISIWHTGAGKRERILRTKAGNYIMIVHPNLSVIANSNGRRLLETHNYYEKDADGGKRGWWYDNLYSVKDPAIEGDILDLAFNTYRHELVAILNNGKIVFCHEKYCRYHSSIEIITSFNTAAYDFRGCVCDERIREKLRQNGANVDE